MTARMLHSISVRGYLRKMVKSTFLPSSWCRRYSTLLRSTCVYMLPRPFSISIYLPKGLASDHRNASYNITANFNADLSQSGVVFNFTISPTTMSETPTCQKTKTPCPPPSLEDAPDVIRNASMYEEPPDVFEYSWIVTNWNVSPTVIGEKQAQPVNAQMGH